MPPEACSPEALKRDLERDVLEIRVDEGADLGAALDLIGPVDGVATDADTRCIAVPVGDDVGRSLGLLRSLQDGGIAIVDFQLRRPTLDDVFLSLTGSPSQQEEVPT